jgi:hypothetical protein
MSERITEPAKRDVSQGPGGGESVQETHPAFGIASVTRSTGTSTPLFQSDVLHNTTVHLSISGAVRGRHLNRDYVHGDESIVEVEMSMAQWGALVSSVGIGSGVPVTIRRTQLIDVVPDLAYEPRLQQNVTEVHTSIDKLMERSRSTLEDLTEAIEGKKGARAIREALSAHTGSITHAANNADFAVKKLVDAGEQVTSQVRADIESQILEAERFAVGTGSRIVAPEVRLGELESVPAGPAMETCHMCRGSGRIATGPWGVNPPKTTCPECAGDRELPVDHVYQDDTI